jgi:drug/metabolite transporter (DMT)-like permease
LPRRERWLTLAAGLVLSLHFITWIGGVQRTSVGHATLILAIAPVLTALGGRLFLGESTSRRLWLGILLGLAAVAVVGGADLGTRPGFLAGDGLIVISAVAFAAYTLFGRRLRPHLPAATYAAALYAVAGVASFGVLLALGQPAVAYSPRNWLCFVLMAAIPTGMGHTAINMALRYLSAATVTVLTLAEPSLASLVAYVAWGEPITLAMVASYALVVAAVAIAVGDSALSRARG